MNRHSYIAELTQLLYYMTPWDREAAVEKYNKMLEASEDLDALVKEIGSPMKLAVTLSRGYEPSPEPSSLPEPAPVVEAETEPVPEESAPQGEPAEAPAQEAALKEVPTEAVLHPAEESPGYSIPEDMPTAEEDAPVEDAEDAPEEPLGEGPDNSHQPVHNPHGVNIEGEEIFSEIYAAATEAQSAIVSESEPHQEDKPKRKPKLGVLVPYIIFCILLCIPVIILLFAVNIMIFVIAIAALAGGIYILTFLKDVQFSGLGDKLVIIGLSILAFTASVAIVALGIWFLRNAAIGFPQFLIQFGRKHGYQEVDET